MSFETSAPTINEMPGSQPHGKYIANVKWFNKQIGFGFATIMDGDDLVPRGKDIFVHHSAIKPLNSNFRTLRKGEYVQMDVVNGDKGMQATNVTGILGGPLMCDSVIYTPMEGSLPIQVIVPPRQGGASGANA